MEKISFKAFKEKISAGCALLLRQYKETEDEELRFEPNADPMQYSKVILMCKGFKRVYMTFSDGTIEYAQFYHSPGDKYFTLGKKYLVVSRNKCWLVYAVPQAA